MSTDPGDAAELRKLGEALAPSGLVVRGVVVFRAHEVAPQDISGRNAQSAVLVGNAGGSMWPAFSRWLAAQEIDQPDPLDTWSRQVIGNVGREFGMRAVYPSDRPWLPFQQWAVRAERLKASPIGILMHPQYGLWHAYRGALLSSSIIAAEPSEDPIHLCDACVGKPCLNSCPVQALSTAGLDAGRCREHVNAPAGAACRKTGCIARNTCPHDRHRYAVEQHAFHLAAFATAD